MQNEFKIKVSVLCSDRTKELTNHKKEKNINLKKFGSEVYFFDPKEGKT